MKIIELHIAQYQLYWIQYSSNYKENILKIICMSYTLSVIRDNLSLQVYKVVYLVIFL